MSLESYIRAMPKVELHVHLEGAIRPATLLKLAKRHRVSLPAQDVAGLHRWYTFVDFPHFVEVYTIIATCLRVSDDIELVACEFLQGQAAQNIRHSEVTYTALTQFRRNGISFRDQLEAINRARRWAERELGVTMSLVLDIPREVSANDGLLVADWAISAMSDGVVAFGLGGLETGNPPAKFRDVFDRARVAGLASVPHAGEISGPESIWGALRDLHAQRIGHGVRCVEDPALVAHLRETQVPLEVCPTSNVCLNVVPSFAEHPFPRLIAQGLYVTLNSDDPPMFNTTLTDEYLKVAQYFHFDADQLERLSLNALRASLLPANQRAAMDASFKQEFARLRAEHLP
ncbi:MAG: adenosine deaminase [Chloroflexi bacterium]|nr:adenosine deaminase [Chloroflexota bacterium]